MPHDVLSRVGPTAAEYRTLADAAAAVRAADLPPRRQQELVSALNTVGRVLGIDLDQIPAAPRLLGQRLSEANPLAHGISQGRWANVRSLTRSALTLVTAVSASRSHQVLAPAWEALRIQAHAHLADSRRMSDLVRFMRFCSTKGIMPAQIDEAVFEPFRVYLSDSLRKHPETTYGTTCLLWNKLAQAIPGWPSFRVVVQSRRKTWTLPWSAYPRSFQDDVQGWLDRLSGRDPLAVMSVRPARHLTLRTREFQLRAAAAALVQSGRDPSSITGLASLVELDAFKALLRHLLKRPKREPEQAGQVGDIASLLKAIAKHWVEAPRETLDQMTTIIRRINSRLPGLTKRNRDRLRPFDDPANVAALVRLPIRLVEEARRSSPGKERRRGPTRAQALLVQAAVAIELLLMAPIRLANLASIDLKKHILRTHKDTRVSLVIEGHEVKNGEALDFPFPAETAALFDTYLREFRPMLAPASSSALFPGEEARTKVPHLLGMQISRSVRRYTGLIVNAHLFRHIGAKLYLDAHPGAYEVVRRVLGHRSMDTTTRHYAGMETAAAARHYDQTILGLRHAGAQP